MSKETASAALNEALFQASAWTCRNAKETLALGARFGAQLTDGEIVLLDGSLGAGKTIFTKGIATALGIDPSEVTSPSFTLVNRYIGQLTLYHLDLYRLPVGAASAHAVDLDELLSETQTIIVIEWAERLGAGYPLPSTTRRVFIEGDGDEPRKITINRQ